MTGHAALINTCESLLRDGQAHTVVELLTDLNHADIPRQYRVPLTNICRRAGILSLGLKILTPITADSHPLERAEYAIILERAGAVREALSLLNGIERESVPEIHLYRAFCHFKFWNYGRAIPDLKEHIAHAPSEYARLIGKVNLAAALVIDEKFPEALELIEENIAHATESGSQRLRGNSLELKAQVQIRRGEFAQARHSLQAAQDILGREETFESFFVRKWHAVATALERKDASPLAMIRAEALKRRDWESVREADLFRLKVQFDEDLFHHLYFGTPYEAYRKRIESILERAPEADHYVYGEKAGTVLDLATGHMENGVQPAPLTRLTHRVLSVLLRDFYRPLYIAELFAEIFPDERFDIHSSSRRVHQLQFRLRQWINKSRLPLQLVEERKAYSLLIDGRMGFRLPLNSTDVSGWWPKFRALRSALPPENNFTSATVREILDMKPSTSKRFLNWALSEGLLEKEVAGDTKSWLLRFAERRRP